VAWAEAYVCIKWHLDSSNRLTTIDMGGKLGAVPFLGVRGAVSPSSTMWPGPRPTSIPSGILIHPAILRQQIWAENWAAVPLWGGVAGSPSNTIWPGPYCEDMWRRYCCLKVICNGFSQN